MQSDSCNITNGEKKLSFLLFRKENSEEIVEKNIAHKNVMVLRILRAFWKSKILETILKERFSWASMFTSLISATLVFKILFKFTSTKISTWPRNCRNNSLAQAVHNFHWCQSVSAGQYLSRLHPIPKSEVHFLYHTAVTTYQQYAGGHRFWFWFCFFKISSLFLMLYLLNSSAEIP